MPAESLRLSGRAAERPEVAPLWPALLLAALPAPQGDVPAAPSGRAELVLFHGGRVRLDDGDGAVAEALLAKGGRVLAVGSEAELVARAGGAPLARVDLEGGCAVPGFEDAHVRLPEFGCAPYFVDLADCASYAAVVQRIAGYAASVPEGQWIEGRGLSRTVFPPKERPNHARLSGAVPKHPVLLLSGDGEAALANAAAMERGAFLDPRRRHLGVPGGSIELDERGEPSGLFLGAAVSLMTALLPERHPDVRAQCILRAQSELFALGVTTIHLMGADRPTLEACARLRASGLLKLRIAAYLDGTRALDESLARELARSRPGGDRLAVVGVHVPLDGGLAWGMEALLDGRGGAGRAGGALRTGEGRVAELLRRCARLRLQPALEAHGDRACRVALDLVESIGLIEPRLFELHPRLEGAELAAPRDWKRCPELGVIVSVQPARAAAELELASGRIGAERVRSARGWWALAPELGSFAFGSSWPAGPADPRLGMLAARRVRTESAHEVGGSTERDGETARRALAGYTSGAASAAREGDARGRLLPGYFADLTVLDRDPTEGSLDELAAARVRMTVIEGEVVWRAEGE